MKHTSIQLCLVTSFAVVVGDFAFRTWQPPSKPEYMVGGEVHPLTAATDTEPKKHLYLRHSWYLTESPDRAWLQLMGHDKLEVFVNGQPVGISRRVGQRRVGGIITDITRFLRVGQNTIAVHAWQFVLDRPPAVAVEGACEFASGRRLSLADPQLWRAADVFDRRGTFWYETEFPDEHWSKPRVGDMTVWHAQVEVPPRAIKQPRRSQWVTPAKTIDGSAAMARSFNLPARPREGWLRVAATGPVRLAMNGWLVADDRAELATSHPYGPKERTFDISPFLKSGRNMVALAVTGGGEVPHLRADLEASTSSGKRVYVGTDDSWKSAAGQVVDWLQPDLEATVWKPCRSEMGYVGVMPWTVIRQLADTTPPSLFWLGRGMQYLGVIVLIGLVAGVGCHLIGQRARRALGSADIRLPSALPYLALLPSTVLAASGSLMTWDLSWTVRDIYTPACLTGLGLIVGVQWLLLLAIVHGRDALNSIWSRPVPAPASRMRRVAMVCAWLLLISVAAWLRVRDIAAEPIHHDEVSAYKFTMSVFEYGFPGLRVHDDLPFSHCATSELVYYPTALCALFVDDPRMVVRIPSTIWSMATLVLIGYVGWRWFNPQAGYIAALLYAVSPHVIGMANFGRYLSQVQFFTLLTTYLTYEAVRGAGRLRTGWLWGAALSFIAMYLSWEGTGIFGVGLALAVLFQRRRHLRSVFTSPSLYVTSLPVLAVVLGQNAHRVLQQSHRLWYGEGISSLTVQPMWRFPFFDIDYFLVNASWMKDALLPMLAVAAACVLAVNHRWRSPIRFALICLVLSAELMSILLPLRTNRYSYHLSAIVILLAAAVMVAGAEALLRTVRDARLPALRWYARSIAIATMSIMVVVASGRFIRTSELKGFATAAYGLRELRFPDWVEPSRYVLGHFREGDIIISLLPHAQNFTLAELQRNSPNPRTVDYWLESRLVVQATIGDSQNVPLDRRSGAVMLYDVDQLEQLFAEHDRVWYCTMRHAQSQINDVAVSRYLREHMDVVYEDFATAVMLRDKNHRPAPIRLEQEEAGKLANELYLK